MIIGIAGKAGSGKDEFFKLLSPLFPHAKRFAFADEIKTLCGLYFDWGEVRLNGDLKEELADTRTTQMGHVHLEIRLKKLAKTVGLKPELVVSTFVKAFKEFERRGHVTPREVMQHIGTEVGQGLHKQIWVKALMAQIAQSTGTPHHFVTDVRFDSEARAIRQQNGIIVNIQRPFYRKKVRTHSSEAGINPELVNHSLLNIGDLESFKKLAAIFLETLYA